MNDTIKTVARDDLIMRDNSQQRERTSSIDLFTAAKNAFIVGDIMTRVAITCDLNCPLRTILSRESIRWYTRANELLDSALSPLPDGSTLITYGIPNS